MMRRGRPRGFGFNNASIPQDFKDEEAKIFYFKMKEQIDEFSRDVDKKVLVLDQMTTEQRKIVHQLAREKDFRSFSKGKEGSRVLTVSKVKTYQYTAVPVTEAHPLCLDNEQIQGIKNFLIQHPIDEQQILQHYEQKDDICRKNMKNGNSQMYAGMLIPPPPQTNAQKYGEFRQTLPAFKNREKIIDAIDKNQVILITGGTGCGKTTQVPQFILEEAAKKNQPVRVICTQPRRLPAIAVAERVAKERGEELSGTVGYHIRLEQKCTSKTILTYCTSGVLLRLLTDDSFSKKVSHIILDEIHEREQNTDYLLIALKEALSRRKDLKVILMSATMEGNQETFLSYFKDYVIAEIDIPSRLHKVDKFFLADVLVMTGYASTNPDTSQTNFPPVDQWGHGTSRMQSVNTVPDLSQYNYSSSMHPSASTPSFHAANDPIEHIANQMASSHNLNRQNSLWTEPSNNSSTYNDWNTVAIPNPIGNGFYVENGYASDQQRIGFHGSQEYDASALIAHVDSLVSTRPHSFDDRYALNLQQIQYPRQPICDIYNFNNYNSDGVDHELITHLINYLMDSDLEGSILVFLPGFDDIVAVRDRLLERPAGGIRPQIFTLHSQMNSADQTHVFDKLQDPSLRKVILSTNIAEASLTIDDVIFVIDCGKVKEKVYDHNTRISQLKVVWIAKSNAEQRSGRAGRCRNGYCFRLYSENEYMDMNQTQIAEMKRAAIHDVCLHAKMFAPNNMSVKTFLGMAPEPPESTAIENSFTFLQQLGALFAFTEKSPFDIDVEPPSYSPLMRNVEPDITELGSIIAHLPLDPQLARLLLFGVSLKCFNPIVTLVAVLSHRDPFILPVGDERQAALRSRDELAERDLSDHLMLIRAFYAYSGNNSRNRDSCKRYYLSQPTMRMIDGIRKQLLYELQRLNLIPESCRNFDDSYLNKYSNSWAMVQAAIVAGCYPGIGIARSGSKIKKIHTVMAKNATLHPSSVVKRQLQQAGRGGYGQVENEPVVEYMAFQELSQIDEGTALRYVTATTPLHTLLFAGSIRMEKMVIQEFEICSEEFPDENDESDVYQREFTVEIDNFLAYRGPFQVIKLSMKLRFKFMSYFMRWLRSPLTPLNDEDIQLLECMNNVLSMEQKNLFFNKVNGLPEPKSYENHPSFNLNSSQRYNNASNRYNNTNGSNRNDIRENNFYNHGEIQPPVQKKPEKSNDESSRTKCRIVKSNPMFRLAAETTKAAATTSDGINQLATVELKNFIRDMQQTSSKMHGTTTEPKKQENVPPSVAASANDTSSTTISSSVNIQKSETITVPSTSLTHQRQINWAFSNDSPFNQTAQLANTSTWNGPSNDVRNFRIDGKPFRFVKISNNSGKDVGNFKNSQRNGDDHPPQPQQNQSSGNGRVFYNSSRNSKYQNGNNFKSRWSNENRQQNGSGNDGSPKQFSRNSQNRSSNA